MRENSPLIVTAGQTYIDIDAYASMIAYRELLKADGIEAEASTTGVINQSVPPLILKLKYQLDPVSTPDNAKFIVVDVSNPKFLDKRVNLPNLTEVIDHHTGFEEYWAAQTGVKSQIEFIGSVCTMIFEKIMGSKHPEILDTDLCKLLIAGILDNTLNLRATITTERDRRAYAELLKIGHVPKNWYKEYFSACETEVMKDLATAIKNDIKAEKVGILPAVIGQMVVLDQTNLDLCLISAAFNEYPEWMMNLISLEDGKSYIYFSDTGVGERLEKLFGRKRTSDNLIILDPFLLRKQILKIARDGHQIANA